MPMLLRLVLDTNVWLDWLVFDDPDVAPVKAAVAAGRAEVYIDEAVAEELVRVLGYSFGIRTLSAQEQAACLDRCHRIARMWLAATGGSDGAAGDEHRRTLPVCADPDDQKFLDLAAACGASYLVTRDRDLLELARFRDPVPPFGIITPRQFAQAAGAAPR